MDLNNFVCIYLITCFSSDQVKDGCPQNCDCYSAPEDGDGMNTAYSLICDWRDANLVSPQRYNDLLGKSINTFVIDRYFDPDLEKDVFPNDFSINNLVLRDSRLHFSDIPLKNLDKNSFKVLTVFNTDFDETGPQSTFPEGFNELKAIFMRGGTFKVIDKHFRVDSMNSVISIMFDNTNLETIDDNALVNFKSLKMVTVMKNSITTLNWLLTFDCPIWYLDLRNNKIREFPEALAKKLTKLRTLKLGGNNIHYISPATINILMANLNELDFQQAKGMTKHTYFYPTEDMIWACTDTDCVKKVDRYPKFLIEYLGKVNCVEWRRSPDVPCSHLGIEHFKYPKKAMSDKLVIVDEDKQSIFSYRNEFTYLVGAGVYIKYPWSITDKHQEYFEIIKQNGNVVKIVFSTFMTIDILDKKIEYDVFNKIVEELEHFMDQAQSNGLFIIIDLFGDDLWAIYAGYLKDENLLQNYLKNKLELLVERLSKYKSIAAWNILGAASTKIINIDYNQANKCFNGQTSFDFQLKQLQKFIGKHAQTIHRIGHGQLVTATMAFEYAIDNYDKTNQGFNHFEDNCLKLAMDNECENDDCYLDFYSLSFGLDSNLSKYQDHEFYRNYIAEISIKPVVISFDKDTDFKKFIEGFEEIYPWSLNGVLAPTVEFPVNTTSANPATIKDGLELFKSGYSPQISKLNQENPILKEE